MFGKSMPKPPPVMGEWQVNNKTKQIVMPAKPRIRRDEFENPKGLIDQTTTREKSNKEWLDEYAKKIQDKKVLFPEAIERAKDIVENSNIKEVLEMVNGPQHYGGKDNPYEVIKVCEAWGLDRDAYLFNVVKYVARAGKKDPKKELEDLKKAVFYLERKVKNLEKQIW